MLILFGVSMFISHGTLAQESEISPAKLQPAMDTTSTEKIYEFKNSTIGEIVVTGHSSSVKSEIDKTTYLITKKMTDASGTGTDLLKLIPGIQIDFKRNISIMGSKDILLLVDGKQRDKSFLGQLDPKQIDKIEVTSSGAADQDGNATGTIDIILKKEHKPGLSGQIYVEAPTNINETYMFPTANLNYSIGKFNLYTTYNGELSYFDIVENTTKKTDTYTASYIQNVGQRNWSHHLHYGIDYSPNNKNQFNFYAFYNPYSAEFDGTTELQVQEKTNQFWKARKDDTDKNAATFYSLYYKHTLKEKGHEIMIDISNYNSNAENTSVYTYKDNSLPTQINTTKPQSNTAIAKIDYNRPLSRKLNLSTGVKARLGTSRDNYSETFKSNEKVFATYGALTWKGAQYDLKIGLRFEKSLTAINGVSNHQIASFFPNLNLKYRLTSTQNIQLSLSHSINRPNIYQLDNYTTIENPTSIRIGNPLLKPQMQKNLYLEHSIAIKGNYMATRLYYNNTTDAINNLTYLNDDQAFETQPNNLGTIQQFGIQLLGSLRLGNSSLNPYIRFYDQQTIGNELAKAHEVINRNSLGLEMGMSAIVSFKYNFTFSFSGQYATPKNNIQDNDHCDVLYFLSLNKAFLKNLKVGIESYLPFSRFFVYNASEFKTANYSSRYEGNIKLSVPLQFSINWQFNAGKSLQKTNRSEEDFNVAPKKGF